MVVVVAPLAAWLLRCSMAQVKSLQAERDARSAFTKALLKNWKSFRSSGALDFFIPREGNPEVARHSGLRESPLASTDSTRLDDVLRDQSASLDGRFLSGLLSARAMEEAPLTIWMLLFVLSRTLTMFGSVALISASIASYALLGGHVLKASVVFTAMSWLDRVKSPLTMAPKAMQSILGFKVSVDRIEAYIRAKRAKATSVAGTGTNGSTTGSILQMDAATFEAPSPGVTNSTRSSKDKTQKQGGGQSADISRSSGSAGEGRVVLGSVSLNLLSGITVVSGPIGAGKSALISACMGGLKCTRGTAIVRA